MVNLNPISGRECEGHLWYWLKTSWGFRFYVELFVPLCEAADSLEQR